MQPPGLQNGEFLQGVSFIRYFLRLARPGKKVFCGCGLKHYGLSVVSSKDYPCCSAVSKVCKEMMILILADGVVLDAKLWSEEFYYSIKLLSDSVCSLFSLYRCSCFHLNCDSVLM